MCTSSLCSGWCGEGARPRGTLCQGLYLLPGWRGEAVGRPVQRLCAAVGGTLVSATGHGRQQVRRVCVCVYACTYATQTLDMVGWYVCSCVRDEGVILSAADDGTVRVFSAQPLRTS